MTMSHKEDFQRWKARYEAEGTIFYDRLSEVTYTDRDLSVGDRVIFTNDHGVVFGPHEVLALESQSMADAYILTAMPIGLPTVRSN